MANASYLINNDEQSKAEQLLPSAGQDPVQSS